MVIDPNVHLSNSCVSVVCHLCYSKILITGQDRQFLLEQFKYLISHKTIFFYEGLVWTFDLTNVSSIGAAILTTACRVTPKKIKMLPKNGDIHI